MENTNNTFSKVGKFSQGHAVAQLSDGDYVVINQKGEITGKLCKFGYREVVADLMDKSFENGILQFTVDGGIVDTIERETYPYQKKFYLTTNGTVLLKECNDDRAETFEDQVSNKIEEIFENPKTFLDLKIGEDFSTINGLKGFLCVVQDSLNDGYPYRYNQKQINQISKFVDKVKKQYSKWIEQLGKRGGEKVTNSLRDKIDDLENVISK